MELRPDFADAVEKATAAMRKLSQAADEATERATEDFRKRKDL